MGVLTCDYVAALIRKWSKATQHNAWCPIYGHSEKEGFAFNAKYGSSHSDSFFVSFRFIQSEHNAQALSLSQMLNRRHLELNQKQTVHQK